MCMHVCVAMCITIFNHIQTYSRHIDRTDYKGEMLSYTVKKGRCVVCACVCVRCVRVCLCVYMCCNVYYHI